MELKISSIYFIDEQRAVDMIWICDGEIVNFLTVFVG